ncbi:MAG: hypothetical protein M0P91_04710 [Sulfuricurvum sp.]|jgi:hypothetical protein|uniref:hypothetical protein n=1 Tax=Sulfuricurvum sp. TaxID=2025608 RepID=UPI0025D7471D|nr:hypothetical protein [Sulfuricurvum sp.]MCK9372477.1 hypothetical protein [Sulfuricurvum sp.]
MARKGIIESTDLAIESAALQESGEQQKVHKPVTQKEGSKAVLLKKFPEEWHDIIRNNYPGAITDYVLQAVMKQMKADRFL